VFDMERLRDLRQDWDALYTRADRPFLSQGFDWNWRAWTALVVPRGGRPCAVVVRDDGRLRLVWPLAVSRHVGLWSLAAAPAPSECTEPLIERGDDAADLADAACDALWAGSRADLVYIDFVRAESALHAALMKRKPHWTRGIESFDACWQHGVGWDGYYASVPKTLRSQIEARRRRLSERGELRFDMADDDPERRRVVRWILECKTRWLGKAARRSSFVGLGEYEDFLLAAAEAPHAFGSAAIFYLTLNGDVISAEYNLLNETRLDYIIGAYSPDHEKFSPGHILRRHTLKWAFDRGVAYNFGPGRDRYKEAFSNRVTAFADLRLSRSLHGRLFLSLNTLRRRLARQQAV
jgi:CelD/BcsL family acetyltransferase involved in cellulose biosynthesis